jgi:hypothetical protein
MKMKTCIFVAILAAGLGQPALAYQVSSSGRTSCGAVSSLVCVTQVGAENSASVRALGRGNSDGPIAGAQAALTLLGSPGTAVAPLAMSALQAGLVSQTGDRNVASVEIIGDHNRFHVTQAGNGHLSAQTVQGWGNSVAAEQGQGRNDAGNTSVQIQSGSGNVMRLQQFGSANMAIQAQGVSAEAALIAGQSLLSGLAYNNNMLLQQNGDGNEARLAQLGSGNNIALRQQGWSQISVTQLGNGHSISVEQPYGQRGVQIVQY